MERSFSANFQWPNGKQWLFKVQIPKPYRDLKSGQTFVEDKSTHRLMHGNRDKAHMHWASPKPQRRAKILACPHHGGIRTSWDVHEWGWFSSNCQRPKYSFIRNQCKKPAIYRNRDEATTPDQTPEHAPSRTNQHFLQFKAIECKLPGEGKDRGPVKAKARAPESGKARPCLHLGQFLKSCNVQDWRVSAYQGP